MRKTKQKNLINDILAGNYNHPTINQIFEECLKKDNAIGIATVYRNIDKLVTNGKINKFTDLNNIVRYDPILEDHAHFICNNCQKIYDIDLFNHESYLNNKNIISISSCNLFLKGICVKCKN